MNWRFWARKKTEPAEPEPAPQPEPAPAPTPGMFQAEPVDVPTVEPDDDERMNPEIKKRWVAALRSGKYVQGKGRLKQRRDHEKSKYCCLGVLAEIAVQDGVIDPPRKREDGSYEYDGDAHTLGTKVQEWAGLCDANPIMCGVGKADYASLARLNDDGMSFTEIADVIEKQL